MRDAMIAAAAVEKAGGTSAGDFCNWAPLAVVALNALADVTPWPWLKWGVRWAAKALGDLVAERCAVSLPLSDPQT